MSNAVGTEPVVKEAWIDAHPETVFRFFTEPEKMTRWLCVEATVDPRPGGINHQTHDAGDEEGARYRGIYHMRGEFVEVSPPHRVVFTWGYENSTIGVLPGTSTVEVTLEPENGGTRLRLVHSGLPEVARAGHDEGWGRLLPRLAAVAAGRDPDA